MKRTVFDLTTSYADTNSGHFAAAVEKAIGMVASTPVRALEDQIITKFANLSRQQIGADYLLMNSASDTLRIVAETLGARRMHAQSKAAVGMIYPSPHYLKQIIEAGGVTVTAIDECDFSVAARLKAKLENLDALLLIMPNNPTGRELSRDEFKALAETCRDANVTLICDFAFRFFGTQNNWDQYEVLRESGAHWIAVEETKKTFGLHNKGVGILSASKNLMGSRNIICASEVHTQARKYAPVSSFDLALVGSVLTDGSEMSRVVENARLNGECLQRHAIPNETKARMPFAIAGFDMPAYALGFVLNSYGVQTTPAHDYYWNEPGNRNVRISLSADPIHFETAMQYISASRPAIAQQCDAYLQRYISRWNG